MIEQIIFYLFAALLVASSLAVITLRNPVHSVLFLIFAFFNAAGLFVMLGAEFLAMLLVIVYVGAVAVLFLFVVMMLNVTAESFRKGLTKYFVPGAVLSGVLLSEMALLFYSKTTTIVNVGAKSIPAGVTNTEALGRVIYTDYLFLFQVSGLILLVAMIGAITLTFEKRQRIRKQSIPKQLSRSRKNTMEVVKVESGKGVK